MANNLIQIKRSLNTAVPASLANGEFAYSSNGDILFIGAAGAVVPIAGSRNPGTLTANQALVANSTSGINQVIVSNAVITYLTANGSLGSSNNLLASNSTGGIYWMAAGDIGTNVAAQYTWTNTHTFQNTITFSSTINGTANNALHLNSKSEADLNVNSAVSATTANNSTYAFGKSEADLNVNSAVTSNNSTYAYGKTESNLNVNSAISSNNASYAYGKTEGNLNVNSAASATTANNATYAYSKTEGNLNVNSAASATTANNASYAFGKSEADLNVNSAASATSANNAAYLGGTAAGDYATTSYVTGLGYATTTYADDKASNAYANAIAFANTAANTAYANAITFANTAANNAYANAMSDTLSRSGAYTGNNSFSGANIVFSGANVAVSGYFKAANAEFNGLKIRHDATIQGGTSDRNFIDFNAADMLQIAGLNYGTQLRYNQGTGANHSTANPWILNLDGDSGAFAPGANNLQDLGSSVKRFQSLYLSGSGLTVGNSTITDNNTGGISIVNATVSGVFTTTGNTVIGNNVSDVVSFVASVNTSILPSDDQTYSLGSSSKRWKDLYLSGNTIQLGNTTLSDSSNGFSTASASVTSVFKSLGNNILGSTSSDVVAFNASVNTNILPSANVTYNLGSSAMRWNEVHASNLHSTTLYIDGDASISGNLYVTGNVTTINVATLSVTDSLIELASNNNVSDILDIGFYGSYKDGTVKYTGLYRDASDNGIYKLFFNLSDAPDTTVHNANSSYAIGMLQAYLSSGAFVSNATNVAITANSTVGVSITANTLYLSTALGSTYGGTGKSTMSNNALLVGNSSNGYNELTLGTSGYILQSNGTALVYDTLDGGTF